MLFILTHLILTTTKLANIYPDVTFFLHANMYAL